MKLEFSIAFKYLIPRKKRLSSVVVSLFSIGVISLVVWLSIVFISVMHGLEQRWIGDLSRLHSPVKVIPSDDYYGSYYYQVDSHSQQSQYSFKTLGEKLSSPSSDPYDPHIDFSLPQEFPLPERDAHGEVRDLVKDSVSAFRPVLRAYHADLLEFQEGMGYVSMDLALAKKGDPRTFSQLIAYSDDTVFQHTVLPYEESDYQTGFLNPFSQGDSFKKDFISLQDQYRGASVLLPIQYREAGYQIGDQGSISVFSLEQEGEVKLPFHVIGFYNPGISPLGSKTVFIDADLAALIREATGGLGVKNGWHLFLPDTKKISRFKEDVLRALNNSQLDRYWEVTSIYDYEFFKPILDQLQSDQTLFSLISFIILIVACSNIVTMSVLLVHNKKKEIGILKAMGISHRSLKMIFAICGASSGVLGVLLGTALAGLTLKYLTQITQWLSYLQGREVFQSAFFGQTLPQEFHTPTLVLLGIGTLVLAAISGALPARQIAKMHVADILKTE